MSKFEKTFTIAGAEIKLTTGNFGFRADKAIMLQKGETVVMAFVTVDAKDSELDYFPLGVNYIEKYYAAGIISGSRFKKTEGRPSDETVVKGRVIDRAMRPLFPANFRRGVSVVINAMAYDGENDPALLAANAASLVVHLSSVPFDGPVASIRIGKDSEGNLIVNPTNSTLDNSPLNAVVSCTKDAITQLEVEGNFISDEEMSKAFEMAFENAQQWNQVAEELRSELGNEKIEVKADMNVDEVEAKIREQYFDEINEALYDDEKRNQKLDEIHVKILESMKTEEITEHMILEAAKHLEKSIVRANLLEGKRPSGRSLNEIREIEIEPSFLPRVHGSAMFRRGQTQSLSITTLGSTRLAQFGEGLEGETEKNYMHHYVGSNFSYGDAGRFNFYAGNREIGHGALAEKAVRPVLPSEDEFPYAIRVVSEILSQNGSTSMAATCASCLSLMDAGVPIKDPVAGISIGLITNNESQSEFKLLMDVQDVEDFYGDMDFKVCGTKDGITAIQMDTKLKGVKINILQEALGKAREGRLFILEKYKAILPEPRKTISKYAPKVKTLQIKVEQIGELIGPGGKVIKGILESVQNNADVDIKDDGKVVITAIEQDVLDEVERQISKITLVPEIGKTYPAKVGRVENYGAFVDITPSVGGLVHVSELSDKFVKEVNSIIKVGDEVNVKILGRDSEGRLKLSVKQADK